MDYLVASTVMHKKDMISVNFVGELVFEFVSNVMAFDS